MTDSSPRKSPKISDGKPRAYSVDEAAAALCICKDSVYARLRDGSLRSIKLGRRRLITNVEEVLNGALAP